jgi:hypothetical protein
MARKGHDAQPLHQADGFQHASHACSRRSCRTLGVMNPAQPYSLPLHRELSAEERALLLHILEREAPARVAEVARLKVVARCGCGNCPTVIFGSSLDAEPLPARPFVEIANYLGRNRDGVLVGVALLEREGQVSELEAWSPEGGDVTAWPAVSELERIGETDA